MMRSTTHYSLLTTHYFVGLAAMAALLCITSAWAQGTGTLFAGPAEPLSVVISGPDDVAVGRTIVLDASGTEGLGEQTTYRWFRDGVDQPISRSVEAVFTPEEPGPVTIRLVVRTLIGETEVEAESAKQITAYQRKVILVTDSGLPQEKLDIHRAAAAEAGVYLRILQPEPSSIPLSTEESLVSLLLDQSAAFAGAEAIVLWTEGITGLQALTRAVESARERWPSIGNQTVVLITDRSLTTLSRTARGPFTVLRPSRILVTRKEAINPLFTTPSVDAFTQELEQRDIDAVVVDRSVTAFRPWSALTWLVNYMLTHGIPSQTIILLLSLPLIATILTFLKQVIGVTTFGLFTPSIVALSFLALGWWIGLVFLLFILVTGYATRASMRGWKLLYVPKVAIIITVVSITLLLLLSLAAAYGITFSRDTVFILLIMSTLSESFLNVKTEEGLYSAMIGIGETIAAALLCVLIVQWAALQSMLLAYPEVVLLTIVINAALGRWTGLRLVEYFRFREVFKHLQEE